MSPIAPLSVPPPCPEPPERAARTPLHAPPQLLMRRKQLLELELCERLNVGASWHLALGEPDTARELYEVRLPLAIP